MSTQVFSIMVAVFVLGLFIGSNLGVVLVCLLQVSKKDQTVSQELHPVPVEVHN